MRTAGRQCPAGLPGKRYAIDDAHSTLVDGVLGRGRVRDAPGCGDLEFVRLARRPFAESSRENGARTTALLPSAIRSRGFLPAVNRVIARRRECREATIFRPTFALLFDRHPIADELIASRRQADGVALAT